MKEISKSKKLVAGKHLAGGVVEALFLWADENYQDYLGRNHCLLLDETWFSWFLGEWNVARTVRKGKHGDTVAYLNKEFGNLLATDKDGRGIDAVARQLKKRGLTAKVGGKRCLDCRFQWYPKWLSYFIRLNTHHTITLVGRA